MGMRYDQSGNRLLKGQTPKYPQHAVGETGFHGCGTDALEKLFSRQKELKRQGSRNVSFRSLL